VHPAPTEATKPANEQRMKNTASQAVQPKNWTPETTNGYAIEAGQQLWWADLNGMHKPRWVTVSHFDEDDGLIVCKDRTNQHYMTVPEELTK